MMIQYVDVRLKEWAAESFGGYPSGGSRSLLEPRGPVGYNEISNEAWEIEEIVLRMLNPWAEIVRIHYRVGKNKSFEECLELASLIAPPSRRVFRGSEKARVDRAVRYSMGSKKYYALLHQSHEIVDRALKAKNN